MNVMKCDFIQKRVEEHVKDFEKHYPDVEWIVCGACGSMNYNLWDEKSDVDTKIIVFPSLENLMLGKVGISKIHILPNGEHCDIKDVRHYFRILKKGNINFMELLCTEYYVVNPKYRSFWFSITNHLTSLSYLYAEKLIYSSYGNATEKYKKLFHGSPTNYALIEQYGYVAKELVDIKRLRYFIDKFMAEQVEFKASIEIFEEPLHTELMYLKRYHKILTPEEVKKEALREITRMWWCITNYTLPDIEFYNRFRDEPFTEDFLNKRLISVMKQYLKKKIN